MFNVTIEHFMPERQQDGETLPAAWFELDKFNTTREGWLHMLQHAIKKDSQATSPGNVRLTCLPVIDDGCDTYTDLEELQEVLDCNW